MRISLHPHQDFGRRFLLSREDTSISKISGSILADEMGLGKTIQTISLIESSSHKLTLIVAPTTLVPMWESQISRFSDVIDTHVFTSNNILEEYIQNLPEKKIAIICSYGLAIRRKILREIEFDRIVCDEAHYFKNPKSKTFTILNKFNSKSRLALTGTPVQNCVGDIVTLINFILGTEVKMKLDFIKLFLKERFLGRKIRDVGIELPSLTINQLKLKSIGDNRRVVRLTNNIDYEHRFQKIIRTKQSCVYPTMLNKTKLGQEFSIRATENQKSDTIIQSIKDKNEKCIVFTEFIAEQKYFYEQLNSQFKIGVIRGSVEMEERANIATDQSYDILLIQIQTGCVGLNLQHFSNMYFTNIQWNPTVTQQAIGRINRIGQTTQMNVYIYSIQQTIEDHIIHVAERKLELIAEILESPEECSIEE